MSASAYTVYGLASCVYCVRAKDLLGERRARFRFYDIRDRRHRDRMMDRLHAAGVSVDPTAVAVPQIFRGAAYVGGFDALRRRLGPAAAPQQAASRCRGGVCPFTAGGAATATARSRRPKRRGRGHGGRRS